MFCKRAFFFVVAISLILVMHVFLPNVGGVLARQTEILLWIAMAFIVVLSVLQTQRMGFVRESPLQIHILLFFACWIGSIVTSSVSSLEYFLRGCVWLLGGFLVWFSVHQFQLNKKERLRVLAVIFVSTVIEAIIGIIQFFGLYKYIPVTPSPELGMVGGAFQQKNLFASWMGTGIIVSLYLSSNNWLGSLSSFKRKLFFYPFSF